MAAFTTIVAAGVGAAGLGMSAYGASKADKATKSANRSNKEVARQQRLAQRQTVIASRASIRAEALREKQMELEGIRARRDVMRQAQASAAKGLAAANAQGGMFSSSAQAGQQSAGTNQRLDILANLQNIMIGRGVFAANRAITQAQARGSSIQTVANQYATQAQSSLNSVSKYNNLMGFGMNLASNAVTVGNVANSTLFGDPTGLRNNNGNVV